VITYADIQRIFRNEGNTPTLEEIPGDFYGQVSVLLSQVEPEHRKHISKLAGEIYAKRRNKIMLHALRICDGDRMPANAIPVEKEFYLQAVDLLKNHSNKILSEKLEEKLEELAKVEEKKVKVRILKPMPAIVGSDLNNYGPFKEDDVFELPETNAVLLIKQRLAEEFVETAPKAQEE